MNDIKNLDKILLTFGSRNTKNIGIQKGGLWPYGFFERFFSFVLERETTGCVGVYRDNSQNLNKK